MTPRDRKFMRMFRKELEQEKAALMQEWRKEFDQELPLHPKSCLRKWIVEPIWSWLAVAEVFLANPRIPGGGIWQMVDPTGMANPAETVKIGVGRDAADVSFLTSFAPIQFIGSNVEVSRND